MEKSLRNDSPYCPKCHGHLFDIKHLRDDHRQVVAALIEHDAAEVAQAKASARTRNELIDRLKGERDKLAETIAADYLNSPSPNLVALVRDTALSESEKHARSAYFSRDRAMAAVWRIDERHHELDGGKCSCGAELRRCREYAALTFFRATYEAWERRQIQLMRDGKYHGLPEDHPESIKHPSLRQWWKGGPSTQTEQRRGMSA